MKEGDWVHCTLFGANAIGYIKYANDNFIKVKITSPKRFNSSIVAYRRNEVSKGDCDISPKDLLELIDLALTLKDKYLFDAWTYDLKMATKGSKVNGKQ